MSGNSEQAADNRSWSDFEQWNQLFEALCTVRGFAAVNDLAHAYCGRMRRHTQRDLDAAVRSIGNWRVGSHAPSARNLAVLGQILDVSSDPVLNEAWHVLYRKAKGQPEFASGAAAAAPPDGSWMATLFQGEQRRFAYVIAALAVTVVFAGGFAFRNAGKQAPATASATSNLPIPFLRTVVLSVGESAVIHGHRGNCGKPAPDKKETASILPSKIGTGTLTPGGVGVRYSRHCSGNTPAREVIFHAKRAGSEKIELFDDIITISVTE